MGILAGTAPGWVIAPLLLLWLAVSGTSKSSVPSPLLLRGASQVSDQGHRGAERVLEVI